MGQSFSDLFAAADEKARKEDQQRILDEKTGRDPDKPSQKTFVTSKVKQSRRKKSREAKIARRKNRRK